MAFLEKDIDTSFDDIDFDDDELLDFGDEESSVKQQELLEDDFDVDFDDTEEEIETDTEISEDSVESDNDIPKEQDNKCILYIVTDKYNPGMLSYFRNYGVKVSNIFSNIDDAKDTILMQVGSSRLIILDTGTGRFTNMASRKSLVDLMGICDEDTGISVFYTDSIIKSEVLTTEGVEDRLIDWYKYRSTADVLATLLQKSKTETYIYDSDEVDENIENSETILDLKGLTVNCTKSMDLGSPSIKPEEILLHMVNGSESDEGTIKGYKIRI